MRRLKKGLLALGALLGVASLVACDETNTNDNNGNENILNVGKDSEVKPYNRALSSNKYNIDKEYYYSEYNKLHKESYNTEVFSDKDSIVFETVTWEELVYLLESDGNHLILFGGSWCHNTRAAAGYINDFANQYGIKTIYNFDFRLDGETRDTHVRETNGSTAKASEYNYLYGELVSSYLTNLNDWVEYKEDTSSALAYTKTDGVDKLVAKAQVPFLFLYNKDNKKDNSGKYTGNDKSFPIVYGFEEMIDKDENGVYVTNYQTREKSYITEEYKGRLKNIFDYIKDNNISLDQYTYGDYIRESFNDKTGSQLFADDEKININTVSYKELKWLLEQDGNSLILLGGSWCGNTRAVINTINDYAVKNDLIVYIYDTKLDSGLSKSKFGYSTDLNTRASNFPLVNLYSDLIEDYFTNIVTLYDSTDGKASHRIDYVNKDGETISVAKAQVPYFLSFNKDHKDELGLDAPILGYIEEMLVLSESSSAYIYNETNYASYRAGINNVLDGYKNNTGIEVKEISSRI